jgi:hypothetical protein
MLCTTLLLLLLTLLYRLSPVLPDSRVRGPCGGYPSSALLTIYYLGDQINKSEMSGACSTYGVREVHTGFWWGDLREGAHVEDSGIGGRIILKLIF